MPIRRSQVPRARARQLQRFEFIELDIIQAPLIEGLLYQILQVIQREQHKAVYAVEQIDPRVIVQAVNQIRVKIEGST